MTEMTMVEALNSALDVEMKRDRRVVLLGEDIGVNGGVFRVTDKLIDKYPDRVLDTPLAEAAIVGCAVGMAINGLRPVAECQFSGFIYPAFQEIVSHMARMRNRSRGTYTCPMVLRAPYSGGIRALEHHSESMEALYAHIQGLKVVIPSSPREAKGLLIASIRDPDPVLFLEPKKIYRAFKEDVPDGDFVIEVGKANVVQEGSDVTVVSWGAMLHPTLKAVKNMSGISCEVIDVRTISPLDSACIIKSVMKTGRCIIVQEAPRSFGVASEIIAQINDKALLYLKAPITRVTGFDVPFPYYKLEDMYLPNEVDIAHAIKTTVEFR